MIRETPTFTDAQLETILEALKLYALEYAPTQSMWVAYVKIIDYFDINNEEGG